MANGEQKRSCGGYPRIMIFLSDIQVTPHRLISAILWAWWNRWDWLAGGAGEAGKTVRPLPEINPEKGVPIISFRGDLGHRLFHYTSI